MMANKINVEIPYPLLSRAIFQLLLLIVATASIVHKLGQTLNKAAHSYEQNPCQLMHTLIWPIAHYEHNFCYQNLPTAPPWELSCHAPPKGWWGRVCTEVAISCCFSGIIWPVWIQVHTGGFSLQRQSPTFGSVVRIAGIFRGAPWALACCNLCIAYLAWLDNFFGRLCCYTACLISGPRSSTIGLFLCSHPKATVQTLVSGSWGATGRLCKLHHKS